MMTKEQAIFHLTKMRENFPADIELMRCAARGTSGERRTVSEKVAGNRADCAEALDIAITALGKGADDGNG